jgi:hypothetical protein
MYDSHVAKKLIHHLHGFFRDAHDMIAASASDELVTEIPEGETPDTHTHAPSYTLLGDFIQTATKSLLAYRAEEPAEETTRPRPQAADQKGVSSQGSIA